MKKYLPLFLSLFFTWTLGAQTTCTPDTTQLDSIQFISPEPFDEMANPEGGIPDTACVGQRFDFTFTVFVPTSATIGGVTLPVNELSFATTGAIQYEPALSNFSYVCNPPNCVFKPEEVGCVRIFGTPSAEEAGDHLLKFAGSANFGIVIPVEFPNAALFPGAYTVVVRPADAPQCQTSSTDKVLSGVDILASPNPFTYTTQVRVRSERGGAYEFRVYDLLGQLVHRRPVSIHQGENSIDFDGSALAAGVYLMTLTDGRASVTRKMIISRR